MTRVHVLDYVAGNIRSLQNAIEKLGYTIVWVRSPTDIEHATVCEIETLKTKVTLVSSI